MKAVYVLQPELPANETKLLRVEQGYNEGGIIVEVGGRSVILAQDEVEWLWRILGECLEPKTPNA